MLIKEEFLKIIRSPRMLVMLFMLCLLGINIFTDFTEWKKTVGNIDEYNEYADGLNGEIDFSTIKKPVSYMDDDGRYHFADETKSNNDKIRAVVQERYYYVAERNKGWWSSEEEQLEYPYTYTGIENYLSCLRNNGMEDSYKYRYYAKELLMINQVGAPQFVNSVGTNELLQSLFGMQTSFIAICISLIILTAPIFSGEDANNMDMIILSTKNGRGKDVRAKLVSSALIGFLWITVLYLVLLLIHLLLYKNFSALWVNMNWIPVFHGSPYHLTTIQLIFWGYIAYLIGGLAVNMIYCLFSAMLKSAVLSFLSCFLITVLPIFFNPNGLTGMIAAHFPQVSMSADMLFGSYIAVNIFGRPILYSITAPVLSIFIILCICLVIKRLYVKIRIH